jgi:hypothetical protein
LRETQFFCRFLLLQSLQVDKPDKFDLIGLERDPGPVLHRTAAGLIAA